MPSIQTFQIIRYMTACIKRVCQLGDLYTKLPLPERSRVMDTRSGNRGNAPRKPKPKKVTIALGVICGSADQKASAIVLASDSQTTYGTVKSLNAQKINVVNFADAQVLIAQAGTADLAEATIEIIRKKASGVCLESDETVTRIAQEAMREMRRHLIEIHEGCGFTDDAWKRYFYEENAFELLLAYFYERKPYLRTINIDWCKPIPVQGQFKAIGLGADMAQFLLREYQQSDPHFEAGPLIAAAVTEKTIDNIEGCGRPTWVGTVHPVPDDILEMKSKIKKWAGRGFYRAMANLVPQQYVDLMIEELRSAESKEAISRKQTLSETLSEINRKYRMKLMAEPD